MADDYAETNRMLRDLHLARRGAAPPPPPSTVPANKAAAQSLPPTAPVKNKIDTQPPITSVQKVETRPPPSSSIRQPIRSAAQRQAAQRFSAPRAEPPAAVPRVPPPLIGSEDFYKHQQAGIKHARQAYNAKVNDHFDSLKRNNGDRSREEPPAPVDQIGSIAHERASRHVADIREFVAGER
jgi:hypothetical protein